MRITKNEACMKKVVRRLAALALLMVAAAPAARAQDIDFGFDFNTVVPRGEFKDNLDSNGYGIGGFFLVGLSGTPLRVGVDLGAVTYGTERRRESLGPNLPDVRVDVRTSNNIYLGHLMLRAQWRFGDVQPYVDGLAGFKHLRTRTAILDEFDEEIAATTNLSDTSLSYGLGGGVQVRLFGGPIGPQVFFDGKVRYLRGGEAEYLREGSIRRENGQVRFDVLSSRTDVLTAQVGISFRF